MKTTKNFFKKNNQEIGSIKSIETINKKLKSIHNTFSLLLMINGFFSLLLLLIKNINTHPTFYRFIGNRHIISSHIISIKSLYFEYIMLMIFILVLILSLVYYLILKNEEEKLKSRKEDLKKSYTNKLKNQELLRKIRGR